VRKFQESDVEDVLEIFASDGLIHNEEERERTKKGLRKNAIEPDWYDHFVVAELEGKVVARVLLEAAYPPYSELINLYVLPAYQGRGIGTSLVQECLRIADASNCFVMSVMADPVGNLPAHRLYSKFGFKTGILGDPSKQRGHMWLFRFSENSLVSEFIRRHPFAEPSVSESKVNFHERMLYRMSWRDPQTKEKIELYLEGQPSQTPEGTMPRISGISYKERDLQSEVLVKEQRKTISQGEKSEFAISFWNLSSIPLRFSFSASVPDGTMLNLLPQYAPSIEIGPRSEKNIEFEFIWSSGCSLPNFTSFATAIVTCFFINEELEHPLFVTAGFEKK